MVKSSKSIRHKTVLSAVFALSVLLFPSAGMADSLVEAVPTNWRLQDFLDGQVIMFFTPSTCPQGLLTLQAGAPADSKNRLWAMIMTAKIAGKPVGIYYSGPGCVITNFYLKE